MFSFRGGVHPREHKESTEHLPIEVVPPPKRVWLPMSQHTGAPSKPTVKKGDPVLTGAVVGEPAGAISVSTHASVSGVVADVTDLPHPLTGRPVTTVIVDSDGTDTLEPGIAERDYSDLAREQLIAAIRAAGIVGLGGAAFPTFFKLSPPKEKPIDTLLINGCECEPFLTADHRLMLEQTAEMLEGVAIIARCLDVKNVVIGVEDNKPDAVRRVSDAAARHGFRVCKLKTKYPQGAEKQLIKACLRREVPSGGLPMDARCVVQNVGTALAVYEALRLGKPLYERVVTVTGPAIAHPKNVRCRIGTPVRELVEFCGGFSGEVRKLLMGGPMMGVALDSDSAPVLKGTSGILALDEAAAAEPEEHDCIRCGRCVQVCPMGLAPFRLHNLIKRRQFDQARAEHVKDCIECGCCAYGCPAAIRLVHSFKFGKSEIVARERRK